jgi:hypothetical protein
VFERSNYDADGDVLYLTLMRTASEFHVREVVVGPGALTMLDD